MTFLESVVLHFQLNHFFPQLLKLFLLSVSFLLELNNHVQELFDLLFGARNLSIVFLDDYPDSILVLFLESHFFLLLQIQVTP